MKIWILIKSLFSIDINKTLIFIKMIICILAMQECEKIDFLITDLNSLVLSSKNDRNIISIRIILKQIQNMYLALADIVF